MDKRPSVRILLTLSHENPIHHAALECLSEVPRSKRTLFICQRIIEGGEKEKLSPAIQNAIYESVKRAFREQGPIQPPQAAKEISEPIQQANEAGEAKRNFLGFLAALQQDEGEDDD